VQNPLSNPCSFFTVGPDPVPVGGQAAGTWVSSEGVGLQGQLLTPFLEEVERVWANLFYRFPIQRQAALTFSGSRSEGLCWLCDELYILTPLLIRERMFDHIAIFPLCKRAYPYGSFHSVWIKLCTGCPHAGYETTTTSVSHMAIPHGSAPFWPHSL